MNKRVITTELMEEDIGIENHLRPQSSGKSRWIMCFFTGRRGWERQRWP